MKKWLRRIAYTVLIIVALALVTGFSYEQIGRATDARRLPPRIGRAIDIGGRTLNLYCSGDGSPTVILETGGNSPGYDWVTQQQKIAAFTRSCWYDRAGVGWSDPPSSPRMSANIVTDLHELLQRAGVTPPYVMAGASVGGEYVRIYTARYPTEVAGLVLIDSASPDMREPEFQLSPVNRMSAGTRHMLCLAMPFFTRFGIIRLAASRERRPLSSDLTPEQARTLAALGTQPKAFEADFAQACAATNDGRIVPRTGGGNPEIDSAVRRSGGLGDRPLVVLTAGRYWAPPGFQKEAAEHHEMQVHVVQANLARLSTRGRQVIVDAGHDMSESPDAIIDAVREVVDEIRKSSTVAPNSTAKK